MIKWKPGLRTVCCRCLLCYSLFTATEKSYNVHVTLGLFAFCRQSKMNTGKKFSLRRTRREESDLTNQTEKNAEKDSKWTEVRDNDRESQSGNSKNEDVNNPGEKRKLEQDDDDLTDDEEPIQVLKKKDSLKRPKLSSVLDDSDSDEMQGVNKKGSKRSPDGLDDPSPKRMAVSTT